MDEIALHGQIARLEAEIEALAAVLASCRQVMLFARLAMAAAALWLVLTLLGLVAVQPIGLIAAVAAGIGGIVAYGSNASTARQSRAQMGAAEAMRSQLIDRIDLVPVAGRERLH